MNGRHEITDLVKTYTYAGFPEVAGRAAVRSFDPPAELSGETVAPELRLRPGKMLDKMLSFEPRIQQDIIEQTPKIYRRAVREALDRISGASREHTHGGTWSRGFFLESCLTHTPHCIPIRLPEDKRRGFGTFYYIVSYPERMKSKELYAIEQGHKPDHELPAGYKRHTKIMSLAHEFAHVILNEFYPVFGGMNKNTSDLKHEVMSDVYSFACNYALEGDKALPTMDLFIESRLKFADEDPTHSTGAALEEAIMHDRGILKNAGARGVMEYADDLCMRLGIS